MWCISCQAPAKPIRARLDPAGPARRSVSSRKFSDVLARITISASAPSRKRRAMPSDATLEPCGETVEAFAHALRRAREGEAHMAGAARAVEIHTRRERHSSLVKRASAEFDRIIG